MSQKLNGDAVSSLITFERTKILVALSSSAVFTVIAAMVAIEGMKVEYLLCVCVCLEEYDGDGDVIHAGRHRRSTATQLNLSRTPTHARTHALDRRPAQMLTGRPSPSSETNLVRRPINGILGVVAAVTGRGRAGGRNTEKEGEARR